jgi:CRP/FNR family cyclic AMP-dependent transcriptional regulator
MIGYKFLKSHALFGGLTEEEIKMIRPFLKAEQYKKGETIVEEGTRGGKLFFIYEGSVEIIKKMNNSDPARLRQIATLDIGNTFGEMELIDVQPCIATVRALEDTSVLTLNNLDLYKISKKNLKTYTIIILNLAREISRRLRRMDCIISGSLFYDQQ